VVTLARQFGLPVVDDLGSGTSDRYSAVWPDARANRAGILWLQGRMLVCFSGDKLLGGPQAGIIVGKKELWLR